MIEIVVNGHPKNEIIAVCKDCGAEVKKVTFSGYADYKTKKGKMLRFAKTCLKCAGISDVKVATEKVMEWVKTSPSVWKAKGVHGEFIVHKSGRKWSGVYHTLNDSYFFFIPEQLSVKEVKKMCEENKYWED